jgi:hypothetical protein
LFYLFVVVVGGGSGGNGVSSGGGLLLVWLLSSMVLMFALVFSKFVVISIKIQTGLLRLCPLASAPSHQPTNQ